MTDKKLTDYAITVRALEKILELMLLDGDLQRVSTVSHAIDLINRQKAEIEGLQQLVNLSLDTQNEINATIIEQKAEIERLEAELTRVCAERDARICTADFFKAEAIKEFAERLCQKCDEYKIVLPKSNIVEKAMQLFKDMVKIVEKEMAGES